MRIRQFAADSTLFLHHSGGSEAALGTHVMETDSCGSVLCLLLSIFPEIRGA